ncbi:hypothetical protein [Arthrobacter bambusae]|uniref:hypothetical protein n=1 Tax=Arthrobacter bambusae TaxID=1338426 RepID=UPI00277E2398|nr:hypothetical protein [Arthrobacter bambusae]MDQ0240162.1 putative membrane protein [Arthrobacter bambusae]
MHDLLHQPGRDWRNGFVGGRGAALTQNFISVSRGPANSVMALLVAATLGLRSPISSWLSIGEILALLALPVTLLTLRKSRVWVLIIGVASLSGLYGMLLASWSLAADPSRHLDPSRQIFDLGSLVGLVTMTLAGVWCIQILGTTKFLAAWAVGMIPVAVWGNSVFSNNPWKFGLALPVSLLIFIALGTRFRGSRVLAVAIISIICLFFGYRSWLLIVLIAFVSILVAQDSSKWRSGRWRTLLKGSVIAGVAWALSGLVLQLVLDGVLGPSLRDRTNLQIQWGDGNLILGARAEWGAALGLFGSNPLGYGVGVTPSNTDWTIAVRSMYMPEGLQDTSNVSGYFRAGAIEFHSVLWNFWSHYGWAGFLFWGIILGIIVFGFFVIQTQSISTVNFVPHATILISLVWDLFFSPTVLPNIAAALAVAISLILSQGRYGERMSRS